MVRRPIWPTEHERVRRQDLRLSQAVVLERGEGNGVECDGAPAASRLWGAEYDLVADGENRLPNGQPGMLEVDVDPSKSEDLTRPHPRRGRQKEGKTEWVVGGLLDERAHLGWCPGADA